MWHAFAKLVTVPTLRKAMDSNVISLPRPDILELARRTVAGDFPGSYVEGYTRFEPCNGIDSYLIYVNRLKPEADDQCIVLINRSDIAASDLRNTDVGIITPIIWYQNNRRIMLPSRHNPMPLSASLARIEYRFENECFAKPASTAAICKTLGLRSTLDVEFTGTIFLLKGQQQTDCLSVDGPVSQEAWDVLVKQATPPKRSVDVFYVHVRLTHSADRLEDPVEAQVEFRGLKDYIEKRSAMDRQRVERGRQSQKD